MTMDETTEKEVEEKDKTEESSLPGVEEETPPEGSKGEKSSVKKWMPATVLRSLLRKRVLFMAAALLLVGVGGGAFLPLPIGKGKSEKERPPISLREGSEDRLRQEELPRFYIPVPGGGGAQLLVVDFSVVWDPISAVRFRKAEVSLRDRLYDCLTALAAKEEELGEKPRLIEDEMARVFREMLRTDALSVKVREVKSF